MGSAVIYIISIILSMLLFNFVFYKLNCNYKLFETTRRKIDNLNEKNKGKLRKVSFILIVIIIGIITRANMGSIIEGFIFGLLFSFRDICFKTTFMETIK